MKIINTCIRRRVTVAMFTLAIVLFGFVSFFRLKINLLPELTYPTLTIRTEYTGAAPAEIENLITKPVEEALGVVKNVVQVSSVSRSGQSDVILEFAWGTDMDYSGLDVREKLDALELPLDVQRPSILRFDPSLDPIMRFALHRKSAASPSAQHEPETSRPTPEESAKTSRNGFDEEEMKYLRRFAEEHIKKELDAATGIAAVKVSGGLEDEIQVLIDQERMAQLGLSIAGLSQNLRAENVNLSGGKLQEGAQQFLIRTLNQFQSVEEIGDLIVLNRDAKQIALRDVAEVRHGYKERLAITRLNSVEAVEIAIYKDGDANTVAAAREVENKLHRIRRMLPADLQLTKVYDQSTFITQAVNDVIRAAVLGGLLAIFILYLFLRNFWSTVIISMSIPVSVITTFNMMYGADLTLNIMSLGGIALGIGMLLDNSIVVLENIARHRDQGKDIVTAARDGAGEVGMAVTASTLTTVAVFFPLVFVKGIAGQLFRDQALTVTFSLLASLVLALTLIPMLASLRAGSKLKESDPAVSVSGSGVVSRIKRLIRFLFTGIPVFLLRIMLRIIRLLSSIVLLLMRPLLSIFEKGYSIIESAYPLLLGWSLHHRVTVILISLALFSGTLLMVPLLGIELIPQLFQGEFRIEFRLPPGTPLQTTDAALSSVQTSAMHMTGISTLYSVAGTGNRMDANPDQGGENWGELNVILPEGSAPSDENNVWKRLRSILSTTPSVQYKFSRPMLFSFRTPVEIEIAGYDLDRLKIIGDEVTRQLELSSRFDDVKSTMIAGHPEIQIHFDRDRIASLGLAVHEVATRIVNKIRGELATKYSWYDRKIDVLVRVRNDDRDSIERIRKLIINPESDFPVPLETVATIIEDMGPAEIRRIDQERVAVVTANLRFGDLGSAAEEIDTIIKKISRPPGLDIRLAGQNEEMIVSFRSLKFALLLAIFLVYMVMASQFESFLHPFVILFTIPLASIGAILALWLTGSTISVVVFLGLILLAGIVVNNAIVLIDFINQLRARGNTKTDAIMEGSRSRLRPILMTMLTTTLGLLPLALGFGEGAEVRAPMAIVVIGGLTVSTFLTLIVIPVVYSAIDRKN